MVLVVKSTEPDTPDRRHPLRVLAIGLTVPLVGAALLWWIAGSDTGLARLIAAIVIVLALGGWYLSKRE